MSCPDALRRLPATCCTLLIAALAACQPLPQPFAHEGTSRDPVIAPAADTGGVTVLSVTGAPDATSGALLAAMVDSLAEHEIPAAVSSGNRLSRFVQGAASARPDGNNRLRVVLVWDLFDRGGTLIGSRKVERTVDAAAWTHPSPKRLRSLTDDVAGEFAALILNPTGTAAAPAVPRLHVWPVDGVPAADRSSLQRAMEAALRRRDFTVSPNLDGVGLVIAGQFSAGPAESDRRPIQITWSVLDASGKELGKLTQRNAVPAESLEKGWKSLVYDIAENAAGGVSDLVRRLPRDRIETPSANSGSAR